METIDVWRPLNWINPGDGGALVSSHPATIEGATEALKEGRRERCLMLACGHQQPLDIRADLTPEQALVYFDTTPNH